MRLWRSPGEIPTVLAAKNWTKIWGPTHQLPGWAPEWKRHWLLPQRQSQWPAYEEYIEAWTIPQISWVNVCEHLMPFNEISWHNESRWVPLKSREDLLRISNGSHTKKKHLPCKSGSETFSESNLYEANPSNLLFQLDDFLPNQVVLTYNFHGFVHITLITHTWYLPCLHTGGQLPSVISNIDSMDRVNLNFFCSQEALQH